MWPQRREEVPVQRAADVGGDGVAQGPGIERDRVALVDRLTVDDRPGGRAARVWAGRVVMAGEFGGVAVLPHVEVEPVGVVEPAGPALAAGRVEGDQVATAIALAKPVGHGPEDGLLGVVLDVPVAPEDR